MRPSVEQLRSNYLELLVSAANVKAQVLGRDGQELHIFLFETLLVVAKEFVKRIAVLREHLVENKYNDIIASLLGMKTSFIGLVIKDQDRGGVSEQGTDAGERDIVIGDGFGDIALVEALRLDSIATDRILTHVQKVAGNYNPEGLPMVYVLVYYEGGSWDSFWPGYCEYVKTAPLQSGAVPEHSEDPMSAQASTNLKVLRLAYRSNGDTCYVYHIGLNLQIAPK